MDLLKLNLFKGGLFKQGKFLLSSPKRASKALFVSETGVLSLEVMPMNTGYISYLPNKMSWLVVHQLKSRFEGIDDPVLEISERSYLPLDPFGTFTEKDKKGILSLWQIAKLKYNEKCAEILNAQSQGMTGLWHTTLIFGFVLIILNLALHFFKH